MARKPKEGELPVTKHKPVAGKLVNAKPEAILNRYLSDENTQSIAKSYGCTRQALAQFLVKHAEEDWKSAQTVRAIARKESAEDAMEAIEAMIQSADKDERERLQLRLSLARERLKAAQWDLERVFKRIYGTDQPPAGLQTVHIHVGITRQSPVDAEQQGQIIEGTTLNNT